MLEEILGCERTLLAEEFEEDVAGCCLEDYFCCWRGFEIVYLAHIYGALDWLIRRSPLKLVNMRTKLVVMSATSELCEVTFRTALLYSTANNIELSQHIL